MPPVRPPASVFRIVSTVSCPGVTMISSETPRNAMKFGTRHSSRSSHGPTCAFTHCGSQAGPNAWRTSGVSPLARGDRTGRLDRCRQQNLDLLAEVPSAERQVSDFGHDDDLPEWPDHGRQRAGELPRTAWIGGRDRRHEADQERTGQDRCSSDANSHLGPPSVPAARPWYDRPQLVHSRGVPINPTRHEPRRPPGRREASPSRPKESAGLSAADAIVARTKPGMPGSVAGELRGATIDQCETTTWRPSHRISRPPSTLALPIT